MKDQTHMMLLVVANLLLLGILVTLNMRKTVEKIDPVEYDNIVARLAGPLAATALTPQGERISTQIAYVKDTLGQL